MKKIDSNPKFSRERPKTAFEDRLESMNAIPPRVRPPQTYGPSDWRFTLASVIQTVHGPRCCMRRAHGLQPRDHGVPKADRVPVASNRGDPVGENDSQPRRRENRKGEPVNQTAKSVAI